MFQASFPEERPAMKGALSQWLRVIFWLLDRAAPDSATPAEIGFLLWDFGLAAARPLFG